MVRMTAAEYLRGKGGESVLSVDKREVFICGNQEEIFSEFSKLVQKLLEMGIPEQKIYSSIRTARSRAKGSTVQRVMARENQEIQDREETLDYLRRIFDL